MKTLSSIRDAELGGGVGDSGPCSFVTGFSFERTVWESHSLAKTFEICLWFGRDKWIGSWSAMIACARR